MAIDNDLRRVIAMTESGMRSYAIRFEPSVYARVQQGLYSAEASRCAAANRCSILTSHVLVSMSYGLYQVMGFNIYADPKNSYLPIGNFLGDVNRQDIIFEDFLKTNGIADYTFADLKSDPAVRLHFISKYNGPGDVEGYYDLMCRAAGELKLI